MGRGQSPFEERTVKLDLTCEKVQAFHKEQMQQRPGKTFLGLWVERLSVCQKQREPSRGKGRVGDCEQRKNGKGRPSTPWELI